MSVRTVAKWGGTLGVVGIVVTVTIGVLFGQPLLFGFVDSGSMQPSLDPGDGFVVLPPEVAGDVETGDVIVFRAETLHGGGLVTHRVVGVSEQGFITKGDANSFRDQASGEPPVKRAQITGVAVQVHGQVVAIPYLGTAVTGVSNLLQTVQTRVAMLTGMSAFVGVDGMAYLLFGLSLVWYALGAWRDRGGGSRRRSPARETGLSVRLVLVVLATLVVVGATASMMVPAGAHKYEVVSAEFDAEGARVIPTGETETTVHTMGNGGLVPMHVFLEPGSRGIEVAPHEIRLGSQSQSNATVTLTAPPETGYYRRYLVEHRYLAILPQQHVHALYHLHPWTPIVVIDVLLGGSVYLLGRAILGNGRLRFRDSDRPSRLGRFFSRFT